MRTAKKEGHKEASSRENALRHFRGAGRGKGYLSALVEYRNLERQTPLIQANLGKAEVQKPDGHAR